MAKRLIDCAFWTDSKVQDMTPGEKLIMLCMITAPGGHISGIHQWTPATLNFYTSLPVDRINEVLDLLESKGCIKRYEDSWVWMVNQLRHEPSKSPKTITSVVNKLKTLPCEKLKSDFCLRYKLLLKKSIGYAYGMDTVHEHEHDINYIKNLIQEIKGVFPIGKNPSLWNKAERHISILLTSGVSKDDLIKSVKNYRRVFDKNFNFTAQNFFDPEKTTWKDHVDVDIYEPPKKINRTAVYLEQLEQLEKQVKAERKARKEAQEAAGGTL